MSNMSNMSDEDLRAFLADYEADIEDDAKPKQQLTDAQIEAQMAELENEYYETHPTTPRIESFDDVVKRYMGKAGKTRRHKRSNHKKRTYRKKSVNKKKRANRTTRRRNH